MKMKKFKMILIAICVVCGMFFQMKIFGVAKQKEQNLI